MSGKLTQARVISCAMHSGWREKFLAVVKKAVMLATDESKRSGGKTDVREAFSRLIKVNAEDVFGGVWQCFVGKKFAFHVRSNTASDYSKQMIICEVPIGGSSQHLLAYRSPPAEIAQSPEPEGEPETPAAAPRSTSTVQVVETDMPALQRAQMLMMLEDVILDLRAGKKAEEAQVDDSKLAEAIKRRIQRQLKWTPTWHVITGVEKLSGWDSAITADKGSRFSAIARPIKVEIFKHNDTQLLPPVAHTMYSWGCSVWLLQAAAYLVAMTFGAAFIWISLTVPEEGTVDLGIFAGWINSTSSEMPQPVARYYAQIGTGVFILLATLAKIPGKLAAQGAARRISKHSTKKRS